MFGIHKDQGMAAHASVMQPQGVYTHNTKLKQPQKVHQEKQLHTVSCRKQQVHLSATL
jgi:hypothetical protein